MAATACDDDTDRPTDLRARGVEQRPFGTTPDGSEATVYTLTNAHGVTMRVTDHGATILSLRVPDRDGAFADVVLGFDSLATYFSDAYRTAGPYFGAVIGRYANRIAEGRFTLDGETYEVTVNQPPNHLHGGARGFDKVMWAARPFEEEGRVGLVFGYTSPAGEEGFPGTLKAEVTYALTDENQVVFDYQATTDQATPVNLTQHTYFNLAGEHEGDILGHHLLLNADAFTPVGEGVIPTGEIRLVEDTPFDFRSLTAIGARIGVDDPQLERGGGYDHNFVLNREADVPDDSLVLAARVYEPSSGRLLEVRTTEPGIQFYSGNFLDGSFADEQGRAYERRSGLALETQHFPDSPNRPDFPSTILRPGEEYRSRTVLRFTTVETEHEHT